MHSVVLDTVGILPFLRLEIAFNREKCSFNKAVKGCSILILAPCLDVYESGSYGLFPRLISQCGWLPKGNVQRLRLRTDGCLHPYLQNQKLRKNFPFSSWHWNFRSETFIFYVAIKVGKASNQASNYRIISPSGRKSFPKKRQQEKFLKKFRE